MRHYLITVATLAILLPCTHAQTLASTVIVGQGCGQGFAGPPIIAVDPPVLGQASTLMVGGLSNAVGIVFASTGGPTSATVFPGCAVQVDLATMIPFQNFGTGTAGFMSILLPIPNDPQLEGLQFTLQAAMTTSLFVPPGGPLVITPAAHVTIGTFFLGT